MRPPSRSTTRSRRNSTSPNASTLTWSPGPGTVVGRHGAEGRRREHAGVEAEEVGAEQGAFGGERRFGDDGGGDRGRFQVEGQDHARSGRQGGGRAAGSCPPPPRHPPAGAAAVPAGSDRIGAAPARRVRAGHPGRPRDRRRRRTAPTRPATTAAPTGGGGGNSDVRAASWSLRGVTGVATRRGSGRRDEQDRPWLRVSRRPRLAPRPGRASLKSRRGAEPRFRCRPQAAGMLSPRAPTNSEGEMRCAVWRAS